MMFIALLLLTLIGSAGALIYLTFKPLRDYGLTQEDFDKSFINAAEWESRAFGYYDKNIGQKEFLL